MRQEGPSRSTRCQQSIVWFLHRATKGFRLIMAVRKRNESAVPLDYQQGGAPSSKYRPQPDKNRRASSPDASQPRIARQTTGHPILQTPNDPANPLQNLAPRRESYGPKIGSCVAADVGRIQRTVAKQDASNRPDDRTQRKSPPRIQLGQDTREETARHDDDKKDSTR